MDAFTQRVQSLSPEKALSIAAYGESVAAYRYRILAERATSDKHRLLFESMADEEQQHHLDVQKILKTHYPHADFVLTNADKEMVVVGPRMLEPSERTPLPEVIRTIIETERLTGRFYAALQDWITPESLRPQIREMAEECLHHAAKLESLSFAE